MGLNFLRALMRKLAPSILIFLGLLIFLSSSFADPFPSKKLIIFQTNDVYRIRAVDGGRRGGLARVAALVAEERRRGSDVLYLHAGDLLFPSFMSRHFQGRQMIEAMNQAGLDMATFGNHEFDDPDPKVLLSRISESRFSWVSSNVLDARTGKPFGGVRPYLLREVGSARVGIFGLTLAERSQAYVRYLDPLVAAEKTIQALRREGVSFLIALTHLSMEEDRALARHYPEIDLIAGGHDHDHRISFVGGTLIAKADSDARTLIRVVVENPGSPDRSLTAKVIPLTQDLPEDSRVRATVERWTERLQDRLGPEIPLSRSRVTLQGLEQIVRFEESNLGNLVADALREETGADLAFLNAGGIRIDENVPPGVLTDRFAHGTFLFDDRVVLLKVSGANIKEALEDGVARRGTGGFLQVSGVRLTYDPKRPPGSRLLSLIVGGTEIVPDRLYRLATTDFLAKGGDGHRSLAGAEAVPLPESLSPRDLFVQYLKKRPEVSPRVDGRIKQVSN